MDRQGQGHGGIYPGDGAEDQHHRGACQQAGVKHNLAAALALRLLQTALQQIQFRLHGADNGNGGWCGCMHMD